MSKKLINNRKCILCKKRKRSSDFFCEECIKKDIFLKIKAFAKSEEFNRTGLWKHYGKLNHNKLLSKEERERGEI